MINQTLEQILKDISNNCLKGGSVPPFLQELWRDKLAGDCFIEQYEYGEFTLVSSYSEEFFEGYETVFIKDELIAKTYAKMFEEIAFIGADRDESLIGYWLFESDIKIINAPIIVLDNEGQFCVEGDNLEDYFIVPRVWERDKIAKQRANKVQEYLRERNLPKAKSLSEIQIVLNTFPDPEKRFDQYLESISDKCK